MRTIRINQSLKNRSIVSFYGVVVNLSNQVEWGENKQVQQEFVECQKQLLDTYSLTLTRMKTLTKERLYRQEQMKIWIRNIVRILEVKNCLVEGQTKQIVEEILGLIKKFGHVSTLNLRATSSSAMAITSLLNEQTAEQLAIEDCLNALKEDLQAFNEASVERSQFISQYFNGKMKQAKETMKQAFNNLMDTVSATVFLTKNQELDKFLTLVETEIALIKHDYNRSATAKASIQLENDC